MKRRVLAILLIAFPAALAACGGGNTGTGSSSSATTTGCPTGSGTNGNGAHVSIGSKAFAEEQLLASMTQLELQAHGFTVDYTFQAKDKAIGQALTGGTIDMLWQYTGTELTDYLGLTTGQFPTANRVRTSWHLQPGVASRCGRSPDGTQPGHRLLPDLTTY